MGKNIRKTCILKIAEMGSGRGDFAAEVQKAVEELGKAANRRLELDDEPRRWRLLNDFFPPAGEYKTARGSVFAFTENQNLNGVVLSPDADSYPITTLSPPQSGNDRTEFVEGLTWFSAYENYVAFFTDKGVSASTLETYFSWLFTAAARASSSDAKAVEVSFRDPPKPEFAAYDMTDVSSLVFRGAMESSVEIPHGKGGKPMSAVVKPHGKSFEMLKSLMKSFGVSPPRVFGSNDPDQLANIHVELKISCVRPKSGGPAVAMLKETAERIRDAGAGSVAFRFADGRVLTADELAISAQMSISAQNGLPNTFEAVRKLDKWLMNQVELILSPQSGDTE